MCLLKRSLYILLIVIFIASCNHDPSGSTEDYNDKFNYIDIQDDQFNNKFPVLDNYQAALYAKKKIDIPNMQVAKRQVDFIFHVSKKSTNMWEVQVSSISIIPSINCNVRFNYSGKMDQVERCSSKK